jgi:glycolate oxidase FAD binding subunit
MNAPFQPTSPAELADLVTSQPRVIAVGGGTKPRLAAVDGSFTRISTLRLRGIVEYEPEEFTVSALAGTPLAEITAALAERGQYLPFDPLFVKQGATLGGTVAAGTSGPGRFRFGGVRDFILGVRFVDGNGRLLRMGGKVVKNAAGFDLPKFFVGSLGRFGLLSEITFKVFPRPISRLTLRLPAQSIEAAVRILAEAGQGRWEIDALDLPPSSGSVCLRLAGPPTALPALSKDVLARWPGEGMPPSEADILWVDLGEARWSHAEGVLVKIPLTLTDVSAVASLAQALEGSRVHISAGGNLALVSLPSAEQATRLDQGLQTLGLHGMTLRGNAPLWLGAHQQPQIASAVKDALDPRHRFPLLDD